MIPETRDPSDATGVVVASLDSPTVVSATSCELQFYTVSPACAILLFGFGTTPVREEIIITFIKFSFSQILQVHVNYIYY